MRIRSSGICGSDLMEWYRTRKVPRVLGHEVAGDVVEIGKEVKDFKVGERIVASHHVPCYDCHYCCLGHHTLCDTLRMSNFDPGGFAEYVRLPEINVSYGIHEIPDNVSYDEAAFVEPLACVLRGQEKVNIRSDQTVLIIGCGSSGLLHILLARKRGSERIFAYDIETFRLEAASKLGANQMFKPTEQLSREIEEANDGELADVVIVCAASKEATNQAFQCVGRGGTILFFAIQSPDQEITIPMHEFFWQKGATLTSSYAASPEDHLKAMNLIASGEINVRGLITHRLGLSDISKGFEIATQPSESIKVLIDPTR